MKPSLELPKTLRVPNIDEIPMNSSVSKRLELRKNAKIIEGYRIFPKDNSPEHADLAFNFYAEINIDNSKLWDLMIVLSDELPEEVSLIFNQSDAETNYGRYTDKKRTLQFLQHYKNEIVSDTFIELGLIFHSDEELIEIFIPESKYIKFWGVNQESFYDVMDKFQLKEIDGIEFVDEYPKVREALKLFDANATEPNELIKKLKKEFN